MNTDVVVLCGGKCGSSSLNQTFNRNGYKSIKVHSKAYFEALYKYDGLIDTINISSKSKVVYIIDCYRTPIERNISSFFENLHSHDSMFVSIKFKHSVVKF